MTVGERLRMAREHVGLTLGELAGAIGKDKSVMSQIECSQRNIRSDELLAFADRLRVSSEELMGVIPDRDHFA